MHTNAIITASSLPAAALFARRTCNHLTPYWAGLEDALYDNEYANPYRPGTANHAEYEKGIHDGNKQRLARWL